jgi:two-component system, OmpR family, response regulator
MKILLIEDDEESAAYLTKGLREEGHSLDHANNGSDGLALAGGGHYDVMIIDRLLPGRDGLALVALLRAAGNNTPVLFLSALGSVTKPFAFAELVARLDVLARRGTHNPSQTRLKVADLDLDLLSRTVSRGGKIIELLPREFKLLEYLMRHAGSIVTRTMLLEQVWDYHFDPQTNVIDVHMARLRQKIDRDFSPALLHTVRGAGYCLRA